MLTSVKRFEGPVARHKRAICVLLLLLTHAKRCLVFARVNAIARELQSDAVAIALIFAIHEDKERKTGRDVSFRLDVHGEIHARIRDCEEGLDVTVIVLGFVFFERQIARSDLDGALDTPEGRHVGWLVSVQDSQCQRVALNAMLVSSVSSGRQWRWLWQGSGC